LRELNTGARLTLHFVYHAPLLPDEPFCAFNLVFVKYQKNGLRQAIFDTYRPQYYSSQEFSAHKAGGHGHRDV
jgi:hypothetical protein